MARARPASSAQDHGPTAAALSFAAQSPLPHRPPNFRNRASARPRAPLFTREGVAFYIRLPLCPRAYTASYTPQGDFGASGCVRVAAFETRAFSAILRLGISAVWRVEPVSRVCLLLWRECAEFAIGVGAGAETVERAGFDAAEADFFGLAAGAVEALGTDGLDRVRDEFFARHFYSTKVVDFCAIAKVEGVEGVEGL